MQCGEPSTKSCSVVAALVVVVRSVCNGTAISDANVKVKRQAQNTDSSGKVVFDNLAAGVYAVKVKKHYSNLDHYKFISHYPRIIDRKKAISKKHVTVELQGGTTTLAVDLQVYRALTGIVFKRKHISLKGSDKYGHWWVELDGAESYGWWPDFDESKSTLGQTFKGVPGDLNGQNDYGGTSTRDPHHGDPAEDMFEPIISDCRSEQEIKDSIRAFAQTYSGKWSWRFEFGNHCHTFQKRAIRNAKITMFKDL